MESRSCSWETFKVEGAVILEKIKALIHEGNVRRVVIEHEGRTIAEFPLTVGVVGAVLAPVVAAIAGDWEAARRVELVLPETGVCSLDRSPAASSSCCGTDPASVAAPVTLHVKTSAPALQTTPQSGCCS